MIQRPAGFGIQYDGKRQPMMISLDWYSMHLDKGMKHSAFCSHDTEAERHKPVGRKRLLGKVCGGHLRPHTVLGLSREDTGEMIQFVRSFKLVRCQTSCRHVRDAGYLNKIPHFALSPERAANSQTAHLHGIPQHPSGKAGKATQSNKGACALGRKECCH